MFVIREGQLEAFAKAMRVPTVGRILVHLREHHPDAIAGLESEELSRRVDEGARRAQDHGLRLEYELAWFVAMTFEVSPRFDRHPKIKAILSDGSIPGDLKVDILLAETDSGDWEEAAGL